MKKMPIVTINMPALNRAFSRAREDLRDVGLLDDGVYLDRIECVRSLWPSGFWGERGWVYDGGDPGWWLRRAGFQPGTIYVPLNAPASAFVPGHTLLDTIRHEFAHAWYWLDKRFVDGPWFRRAFGGRYGHEWNDRPPFDDDAYVSDYACTRPKEDFAETFMFFLKYRNSLAQFDQHPGVRRKLRAVGRAVSAAARTRAPRIRGPRI